MTRTLDEWHTLAAAALPTGQRYTSQRRELVTALHTAARPSTIAELLKTNPRLAQSSVYRNLAVLTHAGIVIEIVPGSPTPGPGRNAAVFELHDRRLGPAVYLTCVECGSTHNLGRCMSLAVPTSYARLDTAVVLATGICAPCQGLPTGPIVVVEGRTP